MSLPAGSLKKRRQAAPEAPVDWEDKFRRLEEKHREQTSELNEKKLLLTDLTTKHAKLREDYKKLDVLNTIMREEMLKNGTTPPNNKDSARNNESIRVRTKEDNDNLAALQQQVQKLSGQVKLLKEEKKQQFDLLEKKKKEIDILKRSAQTRRPSPTLPRESPAGPEVIEIRPAPTSIRKVDEVRIPIRQMKEVLSDSREGPLPQPPVSEIPPQDDKGLVEIARKYKQRLTVAEEQVQKLRIENEHLRQLANAAPTNGISSSPSYSSSSMDEISSKLRESQWKCQQLQSQLDFIQSKSQGQEESLSRAQHSSEMLSQKIREFRRVVEDLTLEKDLLETKSSRVDSLESEVSELKSANRGLEDKISRLCQTPFIHAAFTEQESRMKYEEALRDREDLRSKVEHLQEAIKTNYSALTSLKMQVSRLRAEKEELEKKSEDMKLKYAQSEAGKNFLEDKLRLFSGDEGVELEALEKALTIVKRKTDAVKSLSFLEGWSGAGGDDEYQVSLPAMKRKCEELQSLNLKLTEEVERLENMLKLQASINRDLHSELEDVVKKREKDNVNMKTRASDWEEVAGKRLEKIQTLEAQVRELVYRSSRTSLTKKISTQDNTSNSKTNDVDVSMPSSTLLQDFLSQQQSKGDLDVQENLMEVWIQSGTFVDGVVPPGCSTFVVIDFFDYESQTTSLQGGNRPQWDMASRYPVVVDDFFIRYLATETLTLEINLASSGNFSLLARTSLPLSGLLRAVPRIRLPHHSIISLETGQIIGHIQLDIQLALPISELYRLFLERHPEEKRFLEEVSLRRVIELSAAQDEAHEKTMVHSAQARQEEESRLFNEVEIFVGAIEIEENYPTKNLWPYLSFQFLGFPEKITNVLKNCQKGNFNEKFQFPVVTSVNELRLLRRSRLTFSLIDMKAEQEDRGESKQSSSNAIADENGLLGEFFVSLADLSEGHSSRSFYSVRRVDNEAIVGKVEIGISWRFPFRTPKEIGPRGLSREEVEVLSSVFEASTVSKLSGVDKEPSYIVNSKCFCRYIDPPSDCLECIDSFHSFLSRLESQSSKSGREILVSLFADVENISEEDFIRVLLEARFDCLPSDLKSLFHYLDLKGDGKISIDDLITLLRVDPSYHIPLSLELKMRQRVADLKSRSISVWDVCESVNHLGVPGLLSSKYFKAALRKLGFHLIDEEGETVLFDDVDAKNNSSIQSNRKNPWEGNEVEPDARKLVNRPDGDDFVFDDVLDDTLEPFSVEEDDLFFQELKKDQLDRKEIFEQQRKEILERGKQNLMAQQVTNKNNFPSAKESSESQLRRPLSTGMTKSSLPSLESAPVTVVGANFQTGAEQTSTSKRYSLSSSNINSSSSPDSMMETMATRVQSHFRGYSARKHSPYKKVDNLNDSQAVIPRSSKLSLEIDVSERDSESGFDLSSSNRPKDKEDIRSNSLRFLDIETELRSALSRMQGQSSAPNILGAFYGVDSSRSSLVTRSQFAHVLRQFSVFSSLNGPNLRLVMDYFDLKSQGKELHYPSFVRWILYSWPASLPVSRLLDAFIFTRRHILGIRSLDRSGSGFITKTQLADALRQWGLLKAGQDSQVVSQALSFFETRIRGEVQYGSFCEYVYENEKSRSFEQLSESFYQVVTQRKSEVQDRVIKHAFKLMDKDNQGIIVPRHMISFMHDFDVTAEKDIWMSFFQALKDTDNNSPLVGSITFASFSKWIKLYSEVRSPSMETPIEISAVFGDLSLDDMQKKAQAYLDYVSHQEVAGLMSLQDITQAFEVYEVKIDSGSSSTSMGAIPAEIFCLVCQRCGFPFTKRELLLLSKQFSLNDSQSSRPSRVQFGAEVSFRRFLSWASSSSFSSPHMHSNGDTNAINKSLSTSNLGSRHLRQLLERSLQQGFDLASIWTPLDSKKVGRITLSDFCRGISDLGKSLVVSQAEAAALADDFDALKGDFVLYRRVLSGLWDGLEKKPSSSATALDKDSDGIPVILEQLSMKIKQATSQDNEYRHIHQLVRQYDRKRTGYLPWEDLETLMEELSTQYRLEKNRSTWNEFRDYLDKKSDLRGVPDRERSRGNVSIDVFLEVVSSALNPVRGDLGSSQSVSSLPEELFLRIRASFESLIWKGEDYREAFDMRDQEFQGVLSLADFEDVLQRDLKFGLSSSDLVVLRNKFGVEKGPIVRSIHYLVFLFSCHPHMPSSPGYSLPALDPWMLLEKLRLKIRRRCDYRNPLELKRVFRHFSRRKDAPGASPQDIAIALRDLGLKLTADVEESIFRGMAISGGSFVSFWDFNVFVNDPFHMDLVWKFRRSLIKSQCSERELFQALQRQAMEFSASSFLSIKSFLAVVNSCISSSSIQLSIQDGQRLLRRFDIDDSQRLSLKKFQGFLQNSSDENLFQVDGNFVSGDGIHGNRTELPSSRDFGSSETMPTTHPSRYDEENWNLEASFTQRWREMKLRIEEKLRIGYSWREIFSWFESTSSPGIVDLTSLQAGLHEIQTPISRNEVRELLRAFAQRSGGIVDEKSFANALGLSGAVTSMGMNATSNMLHSSSSASTLWKIEEVIDRIRVAVDKLALDRHMEGFKLLFDVFSRNSDVETGFLQKRELIRSLEMLSISLSTPELDLLFNAAVNQKHENVGVSIDMLMTLLYPRRSLSSSDLGLSTQKNSALASSSVASNVPTAPSSLSNSRSEEQVRQIQVFFRRRPDIRKVLQDQLSDISRNSRKTVEDLKKDLMYLDRTNSGVVSDSLFLRTLQEFGFEFRDSFSRDFLDSWHECSGLSSIPIEAFLGAVVESNSGEISEELIDLHRRLRLQLRNTADLERLFDRFDLKGNGFLREEDFERALNSSGLEMNRNDIKKILSSFANENQNISYRKFLKFVNSESSSRSEVIESRKKVVEEFLDNLAWKFGSKAAGIREAQRIFRLLENRGNLTNRDFDRAIQQLSLRNVDSESLFLELEGRNKGLVSTDDVIDRLEALSLQPVDISKSYSSSVSGSLTPVEAKERLRRQLLDELGSENQVRKRLRSSFEDVLPPREYQVGASEVWSCLRQIGIQISNTAIDSIVGKISRDQSNKIDYRDFIEYLGF